MLEMKYQSIFIKSGLAQSISTVIALTIVIHEKLDLTFGLYDDRGCGTTVARLRWRAGGVLLEGVGGGMVEMLTVRVLETDDLYVARVVETWIKFTQEAERLHRAEQRYKAEFPEPALLGRKGTKVPGDWPGEEVSLTTVDHIYGWIGDPEIPLVYGTIGSEKPTIATAKSENDGRIIFSSIYGKSETVTAGTDRVDAAERWFKFTTHAGQEAEFEREQAWRAWAESFVEATQKRA